MLDKAGTETIYYEQDATYLLRNLDPIVRGKVIGIVAGTGIHHTLLDRSTRRTGIREDDCIRVGIVVIGVPGRRGGNMRLDRIGIDPKFRTGQLQRLSWDVNTLHGQVSTRIETPKQQLLAKPEKKEKPKVKRTNCTRLPGCNPLRASKASSSIGI